MSTYEKRANLAATQVREPALASVPPVPSVAPVAPSEARAFTNRYEIKYMLGAGRLTEVQEALQDYLRQDANGSVDGGYYVHSIYFDSPDMRFLREKFEGNLTRVKPRIRTYRSGLDGAPTATFLELKGRYDRIVEKRRCPIERSLAKLLLTETPVHPNGWSAKHSVLGEFQYMSHRFQLVPTVSVLYHRTAFFGAYWPNLRVTFDRLVLSSPATGLDAPSQDFVQTIPCSQTVMELKYNDKLPQGLLRRINSLGLQQRTFSKYAASVERCFRALNGNYSLH
jgi:hypothetical protein